jgi:histidinol dehydrogenase
MKNLTNPPKAAWADLCKRPIFPAEDFTEKVKGILSYVQQRGDDALKELSLRFDKIETDSLKVSAEEIELAFAQVSQTLKNAISVAASNIKKFHLAQKSSEIIVETMSGVTCWQRKVPIETVGIYIPGGSAPLFSTVLMLAIPALLAGCTRIVLCTPPGKDRGVDPAILYTAYSLGIKEIYKIGGAQAIAAMAYGTETVPKVDKVFGPGNQYVTMAKEIIQRNGTAIDLPAGPSEVLVIADESADADFVAADLLSQAEHGTDSQVILLTNSEVCSNQIATALEQQLKVLPRASIAVEALRNSLSIVFNSIDDCIDFSNRYAPEHLILAVENADSRITQISNAGSVFLGNYSCESAGDYASGTNHTLPTNGHARAYSGVSLDSFQKTITCQKISSEGLQNIGPTIEIMAEAEQLTGHKNAVSIRLRKIKDGK